MTLLRRRTLSAAYDIDIEHRQQRIAFEGFLCNADGRLDGIDFRDEHRLIEIYVVPHLLRRAHPENIHRTSGIEPLFVHIELLLDRAPGSK